MALPSSPPLLPDDFDLPALPPLRPSASGSGAPIGPLERKRQHSDYGSLSSDPLFSDTTEDDEAQDVDRPRRKRVVRGPWWHVGGRRQQDLRRGMAKKESLRNADSGVWMGSDGSDGSDGSIMSSQQRLQELAMAEDEDMALPQAVSDAECFAARMIQMCLDGGRETVDLSGLALNSISDTTLRPLHQLIRSSFTTFTHPPSEDEFSPLTPSIALILSTNQLTSLPTELFNLSNIATLTLRNNHLTQLPPAIARLQRLTEFNIAGNALRYLPWELLDLLHCQDTHRQITVRPNPLLQPALLRGPSPLPRPVLTSSSNEDFSRFADTRETVEKMRAQYRVAGCLDLRGELELRLKLGRMLRIQHLQQESREGAKMKQCREELIYLASSSVRYFGIDGRPLRRSGGQRAAGGEDDWSATMDPYSHAPHTGRGTHTPSLFELSLRSIQRTHDLSDFLHPPTPTTAVSYGLSSPLASALHVAATNAATHGNETCSTCQREYIVARAEWLEYWFTGFPSQAELSEESVLPFRRRACNWSCARASTW
ncbi:hypothetical protein LTR53_005708 [Teratosphaeriaceae sp. CCFEE 6253]|nr:hypothetical protein LTR53_005708 [Teratosphaeriaceae sp. CCFEE 6253]